MQPLYISGVLFTSVEYSIVSTSVSVSTKEFLYRYHLHLSSRIINIITSYIEFGYGMKKYMIGILITEKKIARNLAQFRLFDSKLKI